MGNVFFTADTHFNHQAMITNGWRPFSSVEEMNETLVQRWNDQVRKNDQVWHLGDFGMGPDPEHLEFLQRLNGEKHLITGNHDKPWPGNRQSHKHQPKWREAGFSSIQAFARRRIAGRSVMISHFPYEGDHTGEDRYEQYRLLDDGEFLLHGHVHDAWQVKGRQINVGVDVWKFYPIPLEQIEEFIP